jgi:hypothetical protein
MVDAAVVICVASMSTYDWQCYLTVGFRTSSRTPEKRNRFGKGENYVREYNMQFEGENGVVNEL